MASILQRVGKDGKKQYRVSLCPIGLPKFNITFDNLETAEQWIVEHEAAYRHNYRPYIAWRRTCDKHESLDDYLKRYKGLN